MKAWINEWIALLIWTWHVARPVWRIHRKRFYVWRNTPTWVIVEFVSLFDDNDFRDDEELEGYRQAIAELKLRAAK
jgi:hypothetical protein